MKNIKPETETISLHARLQWLISRFAGMFLNPRKTMDLVAYESKAWVPITIVVLALVCMRIADLPDAMNRFSDPVYVADYMAERGIDSTSALKEISAYKSAYPTLMIFSAPLLVIANVIIISIIVFLIGKFAFKSEHQLSTVINMVAWATVISALQFILNLLAGLVKQGATFPTNLAVFFTPEKTDPFLYNLFQLLDIFLFWEAYLLGIGLVVLYKVSNQRAFNTIGTVFIVIIALNALLASFSI